MKQILFKYFMLITCVFGLSSCGYLLSFGQLMFDGSCVQIGIVLNLRQDGERQLMTVRIETWRLLNRDLGIKITQR
ncbi:hypothetical protein HKO30_09705 [Neisseria meningitidis]|uniref:hypothetical protein n=1 Tax=Neisseria meningitidis TaxID=487 RepID=UPI001F3D1310|nr:hypothetical protein [Neisseria meningitidis]MCE9735715.1 hypothetical protein [Neisseria meningitidis]